MQSANATLDTPIEEVSSRQWATSFSPKMQELIILPTEKCNFRCTYCYEDFELGKMPADVQLGIERFIANRAAEFRHFRFSWFGGEPLLAKDVVLRLSRFALEESKKHGFKFEGGFTTNGYLLKPALVTELLALQQNFFQISLDGWQPEHDKTRLRADGRGTFDVIWQNLLDMRAQTMPFEVVLRVHVHPGNFESVAELCGHIRDQFGCDHRFHVDFQDLRDMGGEGGKNITSFPKASFQDAQRRFRSILEGVSAAEIHIKAKTAESAGGQRASDTVVAEPYICYASKPTSLLIRSNGRIGKCTVALSDPRNDIGQINTDGTITIDNELLGGWIRGFGNSNLEELSCPAHGLPTYVKTIKFHAVSPRQ